VAGQVSKVRDISIDDLLAVIDETSSVVPEAP
jgi:hypothetical protein